VEAARARIAPYLRLTTVMELEVPTPQGPRQVHAKLELLQKTGCFKVRGALSALSALEAPHVVACSGGNHGLGVAQAARDLGRGATIFLPTDAAPAKVAGMKARGAELRMVSEDMGRTFAAAAAWAQEEGLPLVHPYDQAEIIAGQGTLGLELQEQAPRVQQWLVAVGGGGLAAGLALALEGRAEVIPVEPALCPSLHQAQRHGSPVEVRCSGAARTSLGAPRLGAQPWEILKDRVGPSVLVSEEAILEAQRWLWAEARLVAEPGGAAALAALVSGAFVAPLGEPVGVVLCGGNAEGPAT
jgi:threonine dehydratase